MKVIEFSLVENELRRKFWLDDLKLSGIKLERKALDHLFDIKASCRAMILDQEPPVDTVAKMKEVPIEVLEVGSFDCVFFDSGHNIPRILLTHALHDLITQRAPRLSTAHAAYVAGELAISAATIIMTIKLGFQKIFWIVPENSNVDAMAQKIVKKYFGIELLILRDSDLTLQPNDGSLLINFYKELDRKEAIDDFAYLNFLRHEGLVMDIPFSVKPNHLLEEAFHSKVQTVDGIDIHGMRDYLFLRQLQISLPSADEYLQRWRALVQKT